MSKTKVILKWWTLLCVIALLTSCNPKVSIPTVIMKDVHFLLGLFAYADTVGKQNEMVTDLTNIHSHNEETDFTSKENRQELTKEEVSSPEFNEKNEFSSQRNTKLKQREGEDNLDKVRVEAAVKEKPIQSNEQLEKDTVKQEEKSVRKKVAITFDDGPHPVNTPIILAALKKYNAKATFFQIGSLIETYPEITQEVHLQGHEVAAHTWSHPDLQKISAAKVEQEITSTKTVIKEVVGDDPNHFRPPYGSTNPSIRSLVTKHNQIEVLWTVDTHDWKTRNSTAILQEIKNHVIDGSIILMHDIQDATVDAIEPILKYLQAEEYEMVTMSKLDPADN